MLSNHVNIGKPFVEVSDRISKSQISLITQFSVISTGILSGTNKIDRRFIHLYGDNLRDSLCGTISVRAGNDESILCDPPSLFVLDVPLTRSYRTVNAQVVIFSDFAKIKLAVETQNKQTNKKMMAKCRK